MAWLSVDPDGSEFISAYEPYRRHDGDSSCWESDGDYVELPKGTIRKLIGKEMTWCSKPVELK